VYDARAVDGDLEPLGLRFPRLKVLFEWHWCGLFFCAGSGFGWCAIEEGARSQHFLDAVLGWRLGSLYIIVMLTRYYFIMVYVLVWDNLLQRKPYRRLIQGALRRLGVPVYSQRDIRCGIMVLILATKQTPSVWRPFALVGEVGIRTRRYLYVLTSPKRCRTR
jgi:hypothetical protein